MYNKNFKYLHIMCMNSRYNLNIIKMVNENTLEFKEDEHLFVLTDEQYKDEVSCYNNVIFDEEVLRFLVKGNSEYLLRAKYIFMHSLPLSYIQLLFLKERIAKKIIWCIWGHDLYRESIFKGKKFNAYRQVKQLISNCLFHIIKVNKIKKFYGIGIGFKYDVLEARKLYGYKIKVIMTPYGFGYSKREVDTAIEEYNNISADKKQHLKIMLGHSAFPFLRHKEILNKLLLYKNEDIKIVIPLSYGIKEYGEKVERLAKELFQDKVEIIKDYMLPKDYVKFLLSVDIAIFDFEHQSAINNILLLLYLNKKLYLSNKGIIRWGLTAEGIKTYNTQEIGKLPLESLRRYAGSSERGKEFSSFFLDEKNINDIWKNTLEELDGIL